LRIAPLLHRLRLRLRPLFAVGVMVALLSALGGLICRAVWFDHRAWSAPVTYAVTVPAAVWLLLFATGLQWLRGGTRTSAAILGCALLLAVPWGRANHLSRASAPGATRPIRLVVWNAAGPMAHWKNVFAAIRAHQPDLVALVEAKPMSEAFYHDLAAHMAEYREVHTEKGLMVLSREDVNMETKHAQGGVMRTLRAATTCRGLSVRVLVVDIASSPLRNHRAAAVARLLRESAEVPGPLILAGDFNTPRDATPMAPLRSAMTHAFEQAGEGFDLTWPAPFPVMTIDHVWLRGWRAVSVRTDWTHVSDHAMLVADLVPADAP
jgi:vancomycin resistance protein VanJ